MRSTVCVKQHEEIGRSGSLLHHVAVDRLRDAYLALKRKAAAGVDGMTWSEYGQDLEARLANLHARVQRGAYRAKPSRRVYIPKSDGRQRPLGIASTCRCPCKGNGCMPSSAGTSRTMQYPPTSIAWEVC